MFSFLDDRRDKFLIVVRQVQLFQEIGTQSQRLLERLAAPPSVNFSMIAREKHLRHAHPPENPGPGVMRVVEKPPVKRIPADRAVLADDPGHEPGQGVGDEDELAIRRLVEGPRRARGTQAFDLP